MKEENQQKTDEELVSLSLEDKDFFGLIVDRYEDKLFRYVRRITNFRDEDLFDILQDVFIKTYENLNDFDSNLSFSSWIYRIAHNQTIDAFRKIKNKPQGNYFDIEDSFLENIVSDTDIVLEASLKEEKEKVKKVLLLLDEKYREILILRFFENKDYKEISDILEKPIGTVGTLVNRAKKQFKEKYEQEF
jgi:RNA polymerase sigma-70 factor (ECF subfamily)